MTLELRGEAWWRAATSRGGSSPEDLVTLLLPRGFHVVYILQLQVHRVPAVRVSSRLRIVVMTRYPDVEVPGRLRGRENGEHGCNGPPIGEEVALVIMRPWIGAEGVVAGGAARKDEFLVSRS